MIFNRILLGLLNRVSGLFPDKLLLQIKFFIVFGKILDLKNPCSFNEKLQWLKLYNRKPEYVKMVDKYLVKDFVAQIIGNQFVIPTIGVWNSVQDIDFNVLPEQFVLKTTHGGGGLNVIICKNKNKLDIEFTRSKLQRFLSADIYKTHREWPYKNVKHRIIAEQYLEDESCFELRDYKFFCFNGKVQFLKVDFNRFVDHHANYYDVNWNLLAFGEEDFLPNKCMVIDKPVNYDKMLLMAETLSLDIPFVRVDMYNIKGHIFFGEFTFFPASGFGHFIPDDADYKIGKLLDLSII